ncbi:MAG: hypothetical protein J2P35_07005 [Actinobacteria bacterium]|nr:hypothetical protein [Actinomycetota bacterium]
MRSRSLAARLCSGMENATRLHWPSHGCEVRPNEKICSPPSSSTRAARWLSRTTVRRPLFSVISSLLRVSRLSAALAAESLTPNSASSATSAADGSGSVRRHQ